MGFTAARPKTRRTTTLLAGIRAGGSTFIAFPGHGALTRMTQWRVDESGSVAREVRRLRPLTVAGAALVRIWPRGRIPPASR
jgi:hypothetical protein